MFDTTHYDLIVGPPRSGKGVILITFKLLGYRVVLAADLSGPNILDLYGSAEKCQITIAEDEMDDIEDDPIKRKMYRIGYDLTGNTTRTLDGNTSNRANLLESDGVCQRECQSGVGGGRGRFSRDQVSSRHNGNQRVLDQTWLSRR